MREFYYFYEQKSKGVKKWEANLLPPQITLLPLEPSATPVAVLFLIGRLLVVTCPTATTRHLQHLALREANQPTAHLAVRSPSRMAGTALANSVAHKPALLIGCKTAYTLSCIK